MAAYNVRFGAMAVAPQKIYKTANTNMKYNKAYTEGVIFEKYLEYLDTIKEKLPKDLFEFVSDSNRHDLYEKSLHDSWVKSVECSHNFETRTADITLILLGAYHDRIFRLCFHNVSQYKISQQMFDKDLITYEIGIEKDCNNYDKEEKLVFRAEFAGEETEIEIYSEEINIVEEIIKEQENGG